MARFVGSCVWTVVVFAIAAGAALAQAPDVEAMVREGAFSELEQQLGPRAHDGDVEAARVLERIRRIRLDYPLDLEQVHTQLRRRVPDLTDAELAALDTDGKLDGRTIDGERRFLYAAASNALFRTPELAARERNGRDLQPVLDAMLAAAEGRAPAARRLHVVHTITVDAGAVPAGEVVRCWIPFPRAFPWQTDIELLASSPRKAQVDREDAPMRSVYLEGKATAGEPVTFWIEYAYTAARRPGAAADRTAPSEDLVEEQPPHVMFRDDLRALRDRVVGDEKDPLAVARAAASWIGEQCVYSYAPEYSTLSCIAEQTAQQRFGDCGQSALLLITLCRMSGVPARWQSGWMLFPGLKTLHDWAEVWVPEKGWVPIDPWAVQMARHASGLTDAQRDELAAFYVGGLDGWRMAANARHGGKLSPPKRWERSDDVDFQRGEVEWQGGNLYFPTWRYRLEADVVETSRNR